MKKAEKYMQIERMEDKMVWTKKINKQLNDFLTKYNLSDIEREELKEWVKSGSGPYDNPYYICDENGYCCNYIEARRFIEELYDEFYASNNN